MGEGGAGGVVSGGVFADGCGGESLAVGGGVGGAGGGGGGAAVGVFVGEGVEVVAGVIWWGFLRGFVGW